MQWNDRNQTNGCACKHDRHQPEGCARKQDKHHSDVCVRRRAGVKPQCNDRSDGKNAGDLQAVHYAGKCNRFALLLHNDEPLLTLYLATTWWSRLRGLFAFSPLTETQGLLISPCNAVHTVGMSYGIDVAFLDRSGKILKLVSMPVHSIAACAKAYCVVEMSSGAAMRFNLQRGQTLQVDCQESKESKESKESRGTATCVVQ